MLRKQIGIHNEPLNNPGFEGGGNRDRSGAKTKGDKKMQGVARNFFTLAIIYALCGMALGIQMAISQDHSQMPVHAHTMVAGWLMSSVFAFFYHLFPAARDSLLARIHFWLTAASGIGLLIGLFFLLGGNAAIEPLVSISSMVFYASMLLFAFIALPAIYRTQAA
jgi:hypothetical protein